MKVLVCWFACFGLVGVFGCLIVGLFFKRSNSYSDLHICSPFFPAQGPLHGARPSDLHIQIQISDSDFRFRFRSQISDSDLHVQKTHPAIPKQ